AGQCCRIVNFGANYRVWADKHTLAALDAQGFVPYRNLQGDIALLPLRCAGGECAVNRHYADRERVPVTGRPPGPDLLHEFRRLPRHGRTDIETTDHLAGYFDLMQVV